jgi:hypothetical protein
MARQRLAPSLLRLSARQRRKNSATQTVDLARFPQPCYQSALFSPDVTRNETLGRSIRLPRCFWLPLVAICLLVCAEPARAQEFAALPTASSASMNPGNAPQQLQQPTGLSNFALSDVTVAGTSPFAQQTPQCDCPRWYMDAESLFLWRDNPFAHSSANDFDVGVGPRVVLGISPNSDWSLQAEYFGVFGMDATDAFIRPQGNLSVPDDPNFPGFSFSDQITTSFHSQLNNVELNVLRNFQEISFLAGFRFVNLSDNFDWKIRQNQIAPEDFSGAYGASVNNNLFGGQLGLQWRHDSHGFIFETTGKAGIFGNQASANGSIKEVDSSAGDSNIRLPDGRGFATAFVGDLNFTGGFHLSQVLSVRAGYNLLWVNNAAMSPDRLTSEVSSDEAVPLYMHRRVFLHGANVGLEAVW